MRSLFRTLQDLSHSQRGLRNSCALLLLIGLVSAGLTSLLLHFLQKPSPPPVPDRIERILQEYLSNLNPEMRPELPSGVPEGSGGSSFSGPRESWLPSLIRRAGEPDPGVGLRFALGLHEYHQGDAARAVALFHQENAAHPHPLVRWYELEAALRARDRAHLNALRDDPEYAGELHAGHFFRMGVLTDDWPMMLRWFWAAEYRFTSPGTVMVTLLAGTIWAALMLSLFPLPLRRSHWLLAAAALTLGWISTWFTIGSGIWLEDRFQLREGTDFISALLYYLVSVGLREELCKVLLFTPFLVRVLKSGRDLEALIFGALVGLGFAVEENINYFSGYQGSGVVVSRFVSANLLHLTLTGVNALALTRAVRDPGRWTVDAVQILAMTIGLHALYNTLLSQPVPGFGDMRYFSGAVLAGCAFLFFREVDGLSGVRGLRISRTALFCWGFCLLFNLELLTSAVLMPFHQALYLTGNAALSAVLIGYIFLHRIQEPMGP